MFKKIMILGIISLAAIAVALMPSPGNFLYRQAKSESTSNSTPTTTILQLPTVQIPVQMPFQFDPIDVIIGPGNQTSSPPVKSSIPQPIKTVPIPIYANLTVTPENITISANQTFKVEIWINNVTGMAGWQIGLLWDKHVIKCISAQVNTPREWGGTGYDWFNKTEADVNANDVYRAWQFGQGLENDYDETHGQFFKCEIWGPRGSGYSNAFNGSIPVLTLTFQALQAGSSPLSFTDVEIAKGNITPIGYTAYEGIVEVQAP